MDKNIGLAILAHMAPKEGANDEKDDSGLEATAHEILAAIKKSDAKALAEALDSFVDICSSKGYPDDSEPGEEGQEE